MATRDTGDSFENDPDYVRRLDRSPEKINHLPVEDKRLMYSLRSAIQGAHNKMQKLRDDVDERDRLIDKEKSLRKSLEDKLNKSRMVDMYKESSVNDELHERLPRSHKERKFKKGRHSDSEVEEKIVRSEQKKAYSQRRSGRDSDTVDESVSESISQSYSKKEHSRDRGSRGHKSKSSRSRSRHDSYSDDSFHTPSAKYHHLPHPSYAMPYNAYPTPPLGPYASPPHAGYMTAYGFTPPQIPQGYIPQGFNPTGSFANPTATSTPNRPQNLVHQINASNASALTVPQGQHVNGIAGNGNSNEIQTNGQIENDPLSLGLAVRRHSDPLVAKLNETGQKVPAKNHTFAGNLVNNISNNDGKRGERGLSSDQSRQIALLLAELDAAKDLNRKLSDRVYEAEREVESLKLQQKTKNVETDANIAARAGELVEEIYRAQKERDAAIMGRLRLANEERDEALARLQRLQKGIDESDDDIELLNEDGQSEVSDLLSRISHSESSTKIRKHGEKIMHRIQQTKHRRKEITSEEMHAILDERDTALSKVKQLEQELIKLRKLDSKFTPEKEHEQAVKAKLHATQQERDMALAKVRRLEDELQNLRVYYSLHKSLSQEASLRDQFNNSLENMEEQLKERDGYVNMAQKENNKLLSQLKSVMEEKSVLQQELDKSQQAQQESNANNDKLERLVNVLRRKINGLGTKVED